MSKSKNNPISRAKEESGKALQTKRAGKLKLIQAMIKKGATQEDIHNYLADALIKIDRLEEDSNAIMKLVSESQSAITIFAATEVDGKFRRRTLELLAEDGDRPTAIKLLKGIHAAVSSAGKAGGIQRHAPMMQLRDWAIEKYRAGKWSSANQAAHDLMPRVIEHGRKIGANLTESNGQRTIAEWIRKSQKSV